MTVNANGKESAELFEKLQSELQKNNFSNLGNFNVHRAGGSRFQNFFEILASFQ